MKRIIAMILAVLMIAALTAACGENDANRTVTTTVNSKYDDGFAKSYASSTKTDSDGNTVYEFSGSKYDEFVYDYKNNVGDSITQEIVATHEKSYGEYAYVNADNKSVIIGLNEGKYDAAVAEAEAPVFAEYGFKFFQNLENPVSSIKVVYCNANDQNDIYGSFDFTAE